MRAVRRVLGLLLMVVLLASCTGQGGADSGGAEGAGDAGAGAGAEVEQAAADSDVGGDRQVITTASATVLVDSPTTAADELVRLAETAGGRVDQRTERAADADGSGSLPSAWLVVRVPADSLTGLLDDLEGLGEVRDLSQESEDVTRAARDLDARITALQTSVDRLLGIMAEADDSAALIAAETAISERQSELESLQSERDYLADQVAMSTLRVDLVAPTDARIEAEGFLGGLETGWNSLVAAAGSILVVTGVLLPWLVVLGVPLA
ncbi:DUF4349 domain-containing protein, partial [Georgenia subflava]